MPVLTTVGRLQQIARGVAAVEPVEAPPSTAARDHAGATQDERELHRKRLLSRARVSKDLSTWTTAELLHRAKAMGATDATISECIDSGSPKEALTEIVHGLEPPHPQSATVEMITVENTVILNEVGRGFLIMQLKNMHSDSIACCRCGYRPLWTKWSRF